MWTAVEKAMSIQKANSPATDDSSSPRNHTADEDNIFDRPSSSQDNRREEIARLAHHYWEERGCTEGQDLADWLNAERIVREEHNETM